MWQLIHRCSMIDMRWGVTDEMFNVIDRCSVIDR